MTNFNMALVAGLLAATALVPQAMPQQRRQYAPEERAVPGARVSGLVVDPEGQPVHGAKVGLLGDSKYPWRVRTNREGRFTLIVPNPGTYRAIADRREEGYAETHFYFNNADVALDLPRVTVYGQETIDDVVVRLGPKQARLVVCLRNAETGTAVEQLSSRLARSNQPEAWIIGGAQAVRNRAGCFDMLVPPAVPVDVEISAPGFQPHRFTSDASVEAAPPITLESGEVREIVLELRPER